MNTGYKKTLASGAQTGREKTRKNPVKFLQNLKPNPKPSWIKTRIPEGSGANKIRKLLRELNLNSVCEDASCPNLGECFNRGSVTFMILGDVCTRRCPFCDVSHGLPSAPNEDEAGNLAVAVKKMGLKFVVLTSVNRDDLKDGGAAHFVACIKKIRELKPDIKVEILTPDFRGRQDKALQILGACPPDIFNHNLETVQSLYKKCRPGADYKISLKLLSAFRRQNPAVPTKSGLMLGFGESIKEIKQALQDLREHRVQMLTLGQYLQPGPHHLPVTRFVHPDEFADLREYALNIGFKSVISAPLARSSYYAESQV